MKKTDIEKALEKSKQEENKDIPTAEELIKEDAEFMKEARKLKKMMK